MNDDVRPMSFRRVAAAAGALFAVVLAFLAIQTADGHDPALGSTPRAARSAAPAPADPAPQIQLPPEYGEDRGADDQVPEQTYPAPEQSYQAPQQSYQPPPVQSTTS